MRRIAIVAFLLAALAAAQNVQGTLKPGDVAPDFTMKDQNGNEVSLKSLRGKNVALAFYVFAFTGG